MRHATRIVLISMQWPDIQEPICAGHDAPTARREALKILWEEHGTGPVVRPGAMCSVPITDDDLVETEIVLSPLAS